MSLLPEIADGKILEVVPAPKPYMPPKIPKSVRLGEEKRLAEINNFGRPEVTEDFSDSKFLQ